MRQGGASKCLDRIEFAAQMADHAKLTLSLMRAGVPNMEILAATDINALVKVAQKHNLHRLLSDEQGAAAKADDDEDAESSNGSQHTPTGQQTSPQHFNVYEGPGGVYHGERNEHGEWEGQGVYKFSDESVYDGEWRANQHHGRGTLYYASGSVYEGQWIAGKKHGAGTYKWHDGRVEVGFYERDMSVGEGAMWSADFRSAWRIVDDGKYVEEISLDAARKIADNCGEAPPSPSTWRSGVHR